MKPRSKFFGEGTAGADDLCWQTAAASLRQGRSPRPRTDFQRIRRTRPLPQSEPPQHLKLHFKFSAIKICKQTRAGTPSDCFKDSSRAFQVFGCLFFVRTLPPLKQKHFSNEFNTLSGRTYHYSQTGISSLISAELKLKIFFASCCAIISVVAFFGRFFFFFCVTSCCVMCLIPIS